MENRNWYPDTCRCVIEITYDKNEPEDTRVHYYLRHLVICDDHKDLPPIEAHEAVVHENVAKNSVHILALSKNPAIPEDASFEHYYAKTGKTRVLHGILVDKDLKTFNIPSISQHEIMTTMKDGTKSHGIASVDPKKVPTLSLINNLGLFSR